MITPSFPFGDEKHLHVTVIHRKNRSNVNFHVVRLSCRVVVARQVNYDNKHVVTGKGGASTLYGCVLLIMYNV